jgi:hypothetical protein
MMFEEVWNKYDFTESDILNMEWQLPLKYVLHLNYYWDLSSSEQYPPPAQKEQQVIVILENCIYLNASFPSPAATFADISNFGTIVGWELITPSELLQNLQLSPKEWSHIFFQIGTIGKIETVCRSLIVQHIK